VNELQPALYEEFAQSMRKNGYTDDDIRRYWNSFETTPGTTINPKTGPEPRPTINPGQGPVLYRQLLQQREDQELDNFARSEMAQKRSILAPEQTPIKPEPAPSAIGTGLKTTKQIFLQGGQHFVNGLYDMAIRNEKGETGYGGESLLGAMTMAMAIPFGAGAAFTQAMSNYVPNMEMTVAIPGSPGQTGVPSPVGILRAMMAVPALLDPKFRELIREHPEIVSDELNRPMTYKELMENIVSFGLAPAISRGQTQFLGRLTRNLVPQIFTTPEPLQVQSAAKGAPANFNATYGGSPAMVSGGGITYRRPASWPDYAESATSWVKSTGMSAEDVATAADAIAMRLQEISKDYIPESLTPKAGGVVGSAAEPASVTPPPTTTMESPGAGYPSFPKAGVQSFPEVLPKQIQDAVDVVKEAFTPPAVEGSQTGYPTYPKVPERPKTGAVIEEPKTTPPTEGRWVDDRGAIPGEPVAYLDASPGSLSDATAAVIQEPNGKYVLRNRSGDSLGEFNTLSEAQDAGLAQFPQESKGTIDVAPKAKVPPQLAPGTYLGTIAAEVEAAMKHYLGDQAGKVDPTTLASMAVGAMLGGTQGTTPEERVTYAFAGLLGGALAKRFATNVVEAVRRSKASGVLDTSVPVNQNFNPPRPEFDMTTRALENVVDAPGLTKERILTNDPPLQRSDIRPAQQISARAAQYTVSLAEKIVKGEYVEPGALKQAFAMTRDLYTGVRKIGVDVGVKNLPPREAVLSAKNNIDKLARDYDPAMSEATLAQMIVDLPDVGLGSRLYYAVPDGATEAMYTGELLGTALVRNGVAMMATMPMTAIARSFAAMRIWDPYRPSAWGGPMAFTAAWEGMLEQIRLMKSWDALGVQAASMGPTKVEMFPRGFSALAEIASDYNLDGLAKGFEYLHSISGVAPGILARTDGMGKAVFGRIGTLWEALEQAKAEGRTGADYWSRFDELKYNYDDLSPEARVRVTEFRNRITANKKFEGAFMQALQAGPQDPWANLGYRLFVAPYIRTPIRLAELHADYTPGLNYLSTNYKQAMDRGGVEASMARGQLYAGVSMATGALLLAQQGYITPPPSGNAARDKALTDAGRPPGMWWDAVSGQYRSYMGLEPVSTVIGAGATLADLVSEIPSASFDQLLLAAGIAETQSIQHLPYLQAISEFYDTVKKGSSDTKWETSLDYIRRRLASFNPAGLRELERVVDPTERQVMKTGAFDKNTTYSGTLWREWYALRDQMTMGVPGLSSYVDAKKKRNMWTGDVILNTTWPFNPFTAREYNGEKWAQEIQRLDGAGIHPLDDWIGGRPEIPSVGMEEPKPSPAVRLTAGQKDRLEVLMTQVVKDGSGNLVGAISALVNSSIYKRMPDVTKTDMIQSRWNEFRQRAEARLLSEDRALRIQLETAMRENQIRRGPTDSPMRQNIQITPR
jgi:hypothetical protein